MPDVRERIADVLDNLPEHRQAEVLDFARFLQVRERRAQPVTSEKPPAEDLLADYVGGVEHGRLAQGIDEELYGA